jgi:thioredoxin reductase (NADPH)
MKCDILIVGAGPAGLTAAIYGARANKSVVVLDGLFGGGEAGKIAKLHNYPGVSETDGFSLLFAMQEQAKSAGAVFVGAYAKKIDCLSRTVYTDKETYECGSIIFATGCTSQKLGVEGEKSLVGYGISYCATCDGALFRQREVALAGSGKKADADVAYLAGIASKVYYITDSDFNHDKVEVVRGKVVALIGKPLEKVVLDNGKELEVPALFVNIGYLPVSSLIDKQVNTDEKGYIITDENMMTNYSGVYAVGDVRKKTLRQIITACSDGAIAAEHAARRKL